MQKKKTWVWSMLIFSIVVISSSLVYLLTDFKTNDVTPNVRFFGVTQLVIVCLLALALIANSKLRNFSWSVYISLGLILFIQILPAFLWFVFNGQVVAETQIDNGVIGHWIYGAFHVVIIIWCVLNMLGYKERLKNEFI